MRSVNFTSLIVIGLVLALLTGIVIYGRNRIIQQDYLIQQQNEEIARQKLDKERAQEEARINQEKIEAENERQRILNEDKDGDGLTFGEEQDLGTSDNNPDTDGDSVPDQYDEHPIGGGRMIVKYLEWDFLTRHWTWELNLPSDVMAYYEKNPRPTWQGSYSYYSEFIESNDQGVERLTQGLKEVIDEQTEWDYYDRVMFAVRIVQQLHYASDVLVGFDDYTKYPMQTLNDETGDCEDMSILTAAILNNLGYDVKLIYLNLPSGKAHMAVGVWGHDSYSGTYWEIGDKRYFYVETTAQGWDFGEFPTGFKGSTGILIDV